MLLFLSFASRVTCVVLVLMLNVAVLRSAIINRDDPSDEAIKNHDTVTFVKQHDDFQNGQSTYGRQSATFNKQSENVQENNQFHENLQDQMNFQYQVNHQLEENLQDQMNLQYQVNHRYQENQQLQENHQFQENPLQEAPNENSHQEGESFKRVERNVVCSDFPTMVLADILGPAFNSRYMSIDKPREEDYNPESNGYKRGVSQVPSFYVDEDYEHVIGDEPAWTAINHVDLEKPKDARTRRKRSTKPRQTRQWDCESKISWMDLGPDYFPRYLRSVECLSKYCWYGHYKCKPRSFTVKILRRRKDMCTVAKSGTKVGMTGLPQDLRVLWVWEERAVNFCCDCSSDGS